MMGTHTDLGDLGNWKNGSEEDVSERTEALYENGSGCSFFNGTLKELDHVEYTTLDVIL